MEEKIISIPVRTALMPIFYKDFHCLAADCRDNCCGGWEIAFNKKDYLRIKHTAKSEKLKAVLSSGMSRLRDNQFGNNYAHFKAGPDGVCAFQTDERLCLLQIECGEGTLPNVCRSYPRKQFYTPAAKEFCLSPSCEGVLALLWNLPQGIDFWEESLPKKDWRTVEAEPRMARFADIRSFCVDVLQERSFPLVRRMLLLGLLLQQLKGTDWAEDGVVDKWLDWGGKQLRDPRTVSILQNMPGDRLAFLTHNVRVLLGLYKTVAAKEKEVYCSLFSALSADGENWEAEGLKNFHINILRYQDLEIRLAELLGHMDEFFENLMVLTAFYMNFPNLAGPEKLWRSYGAVCGLYSIYRFAAVLSCQKEASREQLFQVIITVSRDFLHNNARLDHLADIVLENDGTLDKISALLGG